jgi:hypothetical protein
VIPVLRLNQFWSIWRNFRSRVKPFACTFNQCSRHFHSGDCDKESEEILAKQAEDKTNPIDFALDPPAMAWIERAHWTVSSESKLKPNGQNLIEYLVGEVVILANGPD